MSQQFQCLKCGHVSDPVPDPPKCVKCGSGNGIIEPRRKADAELEKQRTPQPRQPKNRDS